MEDKMQKDRVALKNTPPKTGKSHERGQVLVELALCATIYVMIAVGIFDFSRIFFRVHQLSQVAREGARIASITKNVDSGPGQAHVISCMSQIFSNMGITGVNIPAIKITTVDITNSDGTTTQLVDVNVSQSVSTILGGASFIPAFAHQTISATISMPRFV
jgi:Flp pilus assembly protein TadG